MLNESELLSASADNYMNEEQLDYFDQKLIKLKQETLEEIKAIQSGIATSKVSDISDRATLEETHLIAMRLVERKAYLLNKIDAARFRIGNGDYGYCIQTGEPIGLARLLIRPTAEYCADVKQLNERREKNYES